MNGATRQKGEHLLLTPAGLITILLIVSTVAGGCVTTTSTLPSYRRPEDPAQLVTLWIPENLEIRDIEFSASIFSDADKGNFTQEVDVGGRAFVHVWAVDKQSGQQYLLIYENITERARPIQIIRFEEHPTSDISR